jgi:hypothetical protein
MPIDMPTVIQYILGQRLNEVANSNIAASYTNSSGAIATSQADGVTRAFNDAKNYACRSYWPVKGIFTATYAAGVYEQDYVNYAPATADAVFPTPAGYFPWWGYRAFWGNVELPYAASSILKLYIPGYQNSLDTTLRATPTYFYREGTQGVGVAAVPNASGLVTIESWCIPADVLATDTTTLNWVPGQEWRILADAAAIMILAKASNDAQIQQRLPPMVAEWTALATNKYLSMPRNLRDGSSGATVPFPSPPEAGIAMPGQGQ